MNNLKWIIGGLIFFTLIGLAFYSGRKSVKIPQPIYTTDTVTVMKDTTIYKTITKFIPGKKDTVFIDSSSQVAYNVLVDSVLTFNSDTLNFVADIWFLDSTKTFDLTFDFSAKIKEKVTEVFREVPYYLPLKIYQEPLVIILGLLVAFLTGVVL